MARNADPRANDAASPDRLASADKGQRAVLTTNPGTAPGGPA